MRVDLTLNQRLFAGCIINGALMSVSGVLFSMAGLDGKIFRGEFSSPTSGAVSFLAFAVLTGLLSVAVWTLIFRSAWCALRRMVKQTQLHEQSLHGTAQSEGLVRELAGLEEWISVQSNILGQTAETQRLLISDVAHELCSPLARMQRALSLAERHASRDSLPYMQKLENELQHVTRLVEETLSFSKISALPAAEAPQTFSLRELCESVVARESSGTGVETYFAQEIVIHSRRSAVERALANLVRNAVRYAGAFGPVELHAQIATNFVSISVRDSGPGLPPELLEKIFQPFYRPDSARHRRTGGAGLGLAIVRSCVEACEGSVSAKLRDPRGMDFEIRLPQSLKSTEISKG